MTAWGFADCQRDAGAPGYGSTLGRLFMRTLPEQFKADSSYTWFPLMTPEAMKIALESLGDEKKYDLTRPVVDAAPKREVVTSYEDVEKVLGSAVFGAVVKGRADKVVHGKG